jgi:hypothetical protein
MVKCLPAKFATHNPTCASSNPAPRNNLTQQTFSLLCFAWPDDLEFMYRTKAPMRRSFWGSMIVQ